MLKYKFTFVGISLNLDLFRLDAINKNLSNQMKKELREAKSKEEPDTLVTSAGMELTDETLEGGAGGTPCGSGLQ